MIKITEAGAKKLLEDYYNARRDQAECPEWPEDGCLRQDQIAEQACIEAMTHSASIEGVEVTEPK